MTGSTRTLLEWYAQASAEDLRAGLEWYPEAAAVAESLSAATGGRISHRQACGVIAVLSPNSAWPDNKRAALEVTLAWVQDRPAASLRLPGVYPDNVVKAYRILSDPDFAVCDGSRPGRTGRPVKCQKTRHGCDAPLHGPKVTAFYRAILGSADDGCMDVWATRAATVRPREVATLGATDPRREGNPHRVKGSHRALTAAYRRAAARVGVTPREFQAVVWLTIRGGWINAAGRHYTPIKDQGLPF